MAQRPQLVRARMRGAPRQLTTASAVSTMSLTLAKLLLLLPPGTSTNWSAMRTYSALARRSSGVVITAKVICERGEGSQAR